MKKTIFILFAFTLHSISYAFEVLLKPETGYDTNPFNLANSFNPDGSLYIDLNARLRNDFGKYRIEGRVLRTKYLNESDADQSSFYISTRYRTPHRLFDLKTRSQIMLRYRENDKTFVSRNTGNIATFGGESIADRYDRSDIEIRGNSKIYLNKQVDTRLRYSYLDRNYKHLNITGLSNFDYTLLELSNEWVYAPNKNQEFIFEFGLGLRDYDNKAQRELDGTTIDNTNLKYNSNNISLQYTQALSKTLEVEVSYSNSKQSDNGTGYYDFTDKQIAFEVSYLNPENNKYTVKFKQQDKTYTNSPEFDPNNDGEPSKDGYAIDFTLDKPVNLKNGKGELTYGASYDNFDSNQANYRYDRLKLFIGFNREFE